MAPAAVDAALSPFPTAGARSRADGTMIQKVMNTVKTLGAVRKTLRTAPYCKR